MILAELRKMGDDSVMYMHMQHDDVGGNLLVMADHFGLEHNKDFLFPPPNVFSAHHGFPVALLNKVYNASDALLTTTMGEGWGLSVTEAMATRVPVFAPDHTSLHEILANNRGILVPAGENSTNWIMKEMDNERLRPLMSVSGAARAILDYKQGKIKPDIDAAQKWVQNLSWESITKQWMPIIDKAAGDAKAARAIAGVTVNRQQRRAMERK